MIHSFLLIGQSNMAGRGYSEEAEKLDNLGGRLQVLRNGRWQPMFRPVNPDRPFSGVCLAESFAKAYALDHPDVSVGVIPCADGGTSLSQWKEGSLLFDNAVYNARLAMRTSHLVGILWHQGEGDCSDKLCTHYYENISAVMTALRKELGAENVPLLVGGLGDFLIRRPNSPDYVNYPVVNEALVKFANNSSRTAFVNAHGLTSNPDLLHFDSRSLYKFGLRYYEAFKNVEDKERIFSDKYKMDDAVRSAIESL